jgi:hypothetical protein
VCERRRKKQNGVGGGIVLGKGGGAPHKKVENNYLADLSRRSGAVAKTDLSGVALAKPDLSAVAVYRPVSGSERRVWTRVGGRKAKTLAGEGDNEIMADLNATLWNRGGKGAARSEGISPHPLQESRKQPSRQFLVFSAA